MGVFPIGGQRVGIEFHTAVLDDDEQPVVTEYGEPVVTTTLRWVDGACFEIQTPAEQQNQTVTTSEIGWAMLPVTNGVVPAVAIVVPEPEEPGDPPGDAAEVPAPIQFFDANGKQTITSSLWLWHNGLRYAMRGNAVLEQDIRGRDDHVFCVCEREEG